VSYLKPAEKSGRKFLNPVPTEVGGLSTVFKVLPQYLKNRAEVEPGQPLGPFHTPEDVYQAEPPSGLRVTWFGHSSSLLEIDGKRVLLDPVWEQRASPFSFMGPKRFFAPTIALQALPKIDVVLISHDHYDHLGAQTVRELAASSAAAEAQWVTSLGVGRRLSSFGVPASSITELDWTERVSLPGLTVTSWPARHFTGRGILDRFTTLWASFVIEGADHRVYFGADTGWWEGFGEIAAQYDGFDLTMLEIGAFHPLWASIHLGPDNASRAFEAMRRGMSQKGDRGGLLMPIHWGLFNLALHAWKQPAERITEIAAETGLKLWMPEPGRPTHVVGGQEHLSRWWERSV
jgi:L-ascorbate metabolism protein UlaG (beta-lactamase superfamily)